MARRRRIIIGISVAVVVVGLAVTTEDDLGVVLLTARTGTHVRDVGGEIPYPTDPFTAQVEVLMAPGATAADTADEIHRIGMAHAFSELAPGDLYLDISFANNTTLGTTSTNWTETQVAEAMSGLADRSGTGNTRTKLLELDPSDGDPQYCGVAPDPAHDTGSAVAASVAGRC